MTTTVNGKPYDDVTFTCKDCGADFVFTINEQVFFDEKGFTAPKRCGPCRRANKEAKAQGRGMPRGPRRGN